MEENNFSFVKLMLDLQISFFPRANKYEYPCMSLHLLLVNMELLENRSWRHPYISEKYVWPHLIILQVKIHHFCGPFLKLAMYLKRGSMTIFFAESRDSFKSNELKKHSIFKRARHLPKIYFFGNFLCPQAKIGSFLKFLVERKSIWYTTLI